MSYLLPLGPFGRTLRGPQRIVLRADGERITDIEHRDGYHARGCADRLRRLNPAQSYPLVNRVCGVHSHHHALAWTMALEQLARIDVPPRAQTLRTLVAEAERIASHLHDAARMIELLGLDTVVRRIVVLRELALEAGQIITGHRLVHDFVRPGGVRHDLHRDERTALDERLATIGGDLQVLIRSLLSKWSLRRRARGLAILPPELLQPLGIVGWIARASGLDQDLRRDQPYAAYIATPPRVVVQSDGDVYARLLTLLAEAYESAELAQRMLLELPDGLWRGDLIEVVPAGTGAASVEAPAGRLTYRLVSDGYRLTHVAIEPAPKLDRMLLRAALAGKLVDDAAVVVASLAPCTACAEA